MKRKSWKNAGNSVGAGGGGSADIDPFIRGSLASVNEAEAEAERVRTIFRSYLKMPPIEF
jgi:hypothetical protein